MILIKDFMENGKVITFEIFQNRFGKTAETQLIYNIIYNALIKIELPLRQSYLMNLSKESLNQSLFKNCVIGNISRKMYFKLINKSEILSINREWRETYDIDKENTKLWSMSHECSSEVKLRQLQWKILHRIYPTNTLLFKMKIKVSEECDFCNERDTIIHFFACCPVSKIVWHEAEKKICCYVGKIFKLSEKIIIFGIEGWDNFSNKDIKFINNICLVGKMTISKYKFKKSAPIDLMFENELRFRGLL